MAGDPPPTPAIAHPVAGIGEDGGVSKRTSRSWELLDCALHGHAHVGLDAAEVTAGDELIVREYDGLRWHRCLRCDGWHPFAPPAAPTRTAVPAREEIELPLRG